METGRTISALTAVLAEQSFESGGGQPHSKTLARYPSASNFCKVLDCGSPLPLSSRLSTKQPTAV
jgi:hypothetical protein